MIITGDPKESEDDGIYDYTVTTLASSGKAGIKTASQNGKNLIGGLVLGDDYKADDSWGTVAGKIWNKITEGMESFLTNGAALIAGIVLGDDYSPDDSWATAGLKIWNKIKSGITATGDWIKELIVGEEYKPEESSWKDVGEKVWEAIKTGVTATGDWIKALILGEEYDLDESTWADVGGKLWGAVQSAFSASGDWIKQLVLGEEYAPDSKWSEVGQKLWDSVKSGFSATGDWIKSLILGEDYKPDESSWSDVGKKVWDTIKTGITVSGDWIKELVLGKEYSPGASWSLVGQKIWTAIKQGIKAAGDWIKELIGFTPEDSWSITGTEIWDKIKTGISATGDWIKGLIGFTPEDSWSTIGSAIWDKIKEGISETGDWLKTKLGYSPSDTWSAIGTLIWIKIKSGIKASGDWLKTKLGYKPDDSWSIVGLELWRKIKSGIKASGDWLKTKLGYKPSDSWMNVGKDVWKKIKSGISDSGDWLKAKLGYKPDESWSTIGSDIWGKVQSGITAGKDMASAILEKIGEVKIDVAGVLTTIENAGTFVTNLVGNMLNGKIEWGTKITDLARNIVDQLKDYGWGDFTTTLGQVARNLLGAITGAIPNAIDAAGNAIDVGMELAGGIMDSITAAFSGEGLDLNVGNIVQSLVSKLTTLVPKAFELGGKMLSAGAHIAQSIFGSIATALSDLKASGISETLSTAATELLKNLLQNIGGLNNNAEVNTFLANLGKSIMDGMGELGSIVGDFAGKLIGYLFSEEGLKSLYSAGTSVIELILKGMAAGMAGVINFFGNMIDSILIQVGVIDPEARDAAAESGRRLAETMTTGMQSELKDSLQGQTMQTLMEYFLTKGWQGGQYTGEHVLNETLNSVLNAAFDDAAKNAGDSAEAFRDEIYTSLINQKELDWDLWRSLLGVDYENGSDELFDAIDASLEGWDSATEYLKSRIKLEDILPEDLDFWGEMLAAFKEGDTTKLMNLMTAQGIALFGEAAESAKTAAEEAVEQQTAAVAEFQEKTGTAATEIKESTDGIVQAMDEGANELAKGGMAKAIVDEGQKVEAAALQLSDDTVKEFLLTMSSENGYLIGENFVLAMGTAMSDQTDPMSTIAKGAGQAAYSALSGSASYDRGYSIGSNFGLGFVDGIRSWIEEAARAAAELGAAGTGGLSSSIQEGSPSKITAESGRNFDLGFINSILGMADEAADAAALMGMNAAHALEYTVRRIGTEAAEQTNYPQKSGYTRTAEAYHDRSRANDDSIVDRIVDALNGIGLYFDGELAGHALTRYISEEIAQGAAMRR